ncbi:hypothetical protein H4R18_000104 [Coemansia javaensis]|uniref:J domain-containing protein n=1 Tax=Coemansia javaensis TaxID=2761396 RepID=A0A9W8HM27_9FUNG|nr:hypothetical protein H4R18_000104 [Coemansia javaensis]
MQVSVLTSTAVVAILALGVGAGEQRTTQQYLDEANGLLQRGKYHEALRSYDAAVERDPQNYLTYFKRATTLLTVNRHASAIRDFGRAIELKADFEQAYYQRARAYVKEGSYGAAEEDLGRVAGGSAKLAAQARELGETVAAARAADRRLAQALGRDGRGGECVEAASAVIRISPLHTAALRARGACRAATGDLEGAAADLGRAVRIQPGDVETQNTLAGLHFLGLGERERGLEHARACLRSDPDNRACKATHGRLRALDRRLAKLDEDRAKSKWNTCNRAVAPLSGSRGGGLLHDVDEAYAEFALGAGIPAEAPSRLATQLAAVGCEGYAHTKRWDSVLALCGRVLDAEPGNADALGRQLDAQLELGQLDQAQETLGRLEKAAAAGGDAQQHQQHQQRAREGRARLEQKKRAAARKDYYKILGVARDAAPADIKKAFRKLAHQWHPDRYRGDLPKEQVEAKMADINLAYEVLMDEEARARYDQGHDPNDPGGSSDFGGFGSPFVFQQGEGRQFVFQQGGSSGRQFSFQFGGFPF